jgi:lysozyme family protein
MTDRFTICLPFTLAQEGGNSNDLHDPGGRTHKGIIQREYDAYRRRKGLPLQSDYAMSDAEVSDIYLNEYWLPHCPGLPPGLDLSFFDNVVNEGPFRATVLLQRALAVHDDGVFGPQTAAAIGPDIRSLIIRYAQARGNFYTSLATFKYFGKGWLSRVHTIRDQSLEMVVPDTLDKALDDFTNHPPAPIMKDE